MTRSANGRGGAAGRAGRSEVASRGPAEDPHGRGKRPVPTFVVPGAARGRGPRRGRRSTGCRRTLALTATALLCFAANSSLCRLALGQALIDAASFTTVRLLAGALALLALTRLFPPQAQRRRSSRRRPWLSGLALFGYAACFSHAYAGLTVAAGALLLFATVKVTMILGGLSAGEALLPGGFEESSLDTAPGARIARALAVAPALQPVLIAR